MNDTNVESKQNREKQDVELTEADRNLQSNDKPPLYRFVLTGGPCGGKTTALARIFGYLRERGFEVITCPETYTVLASNGMSKNFFTTEGMGAILQGTVLDVQLAMENGITRVLQARGKPAVLLCDRGTMDGAVYVSNNDFRRIMRERSTDLVQLRDNRYDAIFHLVTAADGAEHFYTLENNNVRSESKEEAIEVDKRTQRAWVGHPHLYVIDNSTDFEGKMNRLVNVMSKLVGLPSNLKRRSAKFALLEEPDPASFPSEISTQEFEVEKVYLLKSRQARDDEYSFIRRRTNIDSSGKAEGSVFQITTVIRTDEEIIEQKRIITEREYYEAFNTRRDFGRHIVRQRRISFLYEKQSFVVHVYKEPSPGLCILHAQVECGVSNGNDLVDGVTNGGEPEVKLPPFLKVDRRITDSKEDQEKYGAYSISVMKSEGFDDSESIFGQA